MKEKLMLTVLTIAGSDPCGGAGVQADLWTFRDLGVYGLSAITALTAQNTSELRSLHIVKANVLKDQLDSLIEDFDISAVKIGMVGDLKLAELIEKYIIVNEMKNIVVDPVLTSTTGKNLSDDDLKSFYLEKLFPLAKVITPNIPEAETLTGIKIDSEENLEKVLSKLKGTNCEYVVLKGGHLEKITNNKYQMPNTTSDFIYDGKKIETLSLKTIDTCQVRGTGCRFSSAIAANMAKGLEPLVAISKAKEYVHFGIKNSIKIGQGANLIL
ncbi:MAG: bifunctional hydroxymethylpyrimidine kinase/phosphomethylpyrimidine kinase [Pseudomonadota bacterium]